MKTEDLLNAPQMLRCAYIWYLVMLHSHNQTISQHICVKAGIRVRVAGDAQIWSHGRDVDQAVILWFRAAAARV